MELVQREARDIAALKDKNRPLRRRLPTRQSLLSPGNTSAGTPQSRTPVSNPLSRHYFALTPLKVGLPTIEKAQEEKEQKLNTFPEVSAEFEVIPDYYYDIKDLNQGIF